MAAPHASLWLQEAVGGDLVGQAARGYDRTARVVGHHFPARALQPFFARTSLRARPGGIRGLQRPSRGRLRLDVVAVHPRGTLGRDRSRLLTDGEYGDRDLELLGGLAHQAKLAIANASSFAGLERTFLSTVEALANALEARDEYTSSHARWITDMAKRVGTALGLDGDTLKRLELGALFPHRQDRDPELGPAEAGAAERGRAPVDRDAPRARRAHHRSDRPASGCLASSAPVTSAWTARVTRMTRMVRDTARGADHLCLRRIPRDDDRPSLPPRASLGGGATPARGERGSQFDPRVCRCSRLRVLDAPPQ